MPYFAERGIETYAVSLRAHGGSDGAESDAYSMADQLDDISSLVSSLPAPPVLVGHSLGGVIAQRWALLWWLDASATRRCRNPCCFDAGDDQALSYAMSRSPPCRNWAGKVAGDSGVVPRAAVGFPSHLIPPSGTLRGSRTARRAWRRWRVPRSWPTPGRGSRCRRTIGSRRSAACGTRRVCSGGCCGVRCMMQASCGRCSSRTTCRRNTSRGASALKRQGSNHL